ncbi:MAG: M28 family peptidase, partial [Vicinamibacterales bacterium]
MIRFRTPSPLRGAALALALASLAACGGSGTAPETASTGAPAPPRLKLGYTRRTSATQQDLETRYRALVDAGSMSTLHRALTARPHPAGSPGTAEVVAFLQQTLAGYGFDVETHTYDVLLARPRSVAVTLAAPAREALTVSEPAIPGDPTSSHPELGDGYIAYSASGRARGDVVYVNYGLPADYEELARLGVSLQGRIALARYGRSHRAVKAFTAEQAGARALVLYSDPADDGAARGPAWPDGYWRGEDMLQRGNAKYSWFFHGDPLTPGVGATPGAARLPVATAPTLPKIPVVVLAWSQAQRIMAAMGGAAAPSRFQGGMETPYRVGPGPAVLEVDVDMDQGLRPIHDVVATLRGAAVPDRTVLFGAHHDAWTFGGVDPGTGTTALLETARALGELVKGGWRPARTIAFAFWDAEEFGLVGSTEYAEAFKDQLRQSLVTYVNIDMYMKGRFDPGGVPSLSAFVADVAQDVPQGASTVYAEWRASETARQKPTDPSTFVPRLKALGSGADFVPFQDHLAVPTMAIEFIGENGYGFGTYHSNYDSRAYAERIADPGFAQGVLMTQVLGTMALRMSEADVLPFRYTDYIAALTRALDDVPAWATDAGLPGDVRSVRVGADVAANAAAALETALDLALSAGTISLRSASAVNDRLSRMEQVLADDDGAADTRWYRHVFYGWNIYSLYDGQPFPGLAEAFRLKDARRVDRELDRIQRALRRMTDEL